MNKKIFDPAPFFFLRIPIWPVDKVKCSLDNESLLEFYFNNQQLREAIAIASPALYEALKKVSLKSLKQEAKSLSQYTSRMMTRPTPFGLFSSVSAATWGETTSIHFDEKMLCKHVRLDMEWIYLFIQKIYQDEKNFPLLPIRTNPLLQLSGERYYLDYLRNTENGLSTHST